MELPSISRRFQEAVFWAPLPIIGIFIALKLGSPLRYQQIITEDEVLENVQFVFYVIAAVTGFIAASKFRRAGMRWHAIAWYLFSAAALLVAIEEVSWFERVTGIHFDSLRERNTHQESNIHNLDVIQPYLITFYTAVGAVGTFGWIFFPQSYVLPPKELCLYFFPSFGLYSFFLISPLLVHSFGCGACAVGQRIVWRDQETVETLLAFGFALNAAIALARRPKFAGRMDPLPVRLPTRDMWH